METGFQLFDILLFAAVAGFLLFRLRSVLGRRTGNERRRADPFAPPKPLPVPPSGPIIDQPAANAAPIAVSGAGGAAALKAAEPGFDEQAFLAGARGAFEIIVKAFAAGDIAALERLLSKDVFAAFAQAIRAREAAHETHETKLVAFKSVEFAEATIEGATALATVKIVSDQVNVTRAADGTVVDGDPDKPVEKTDFWTFSRVLRSRDPNWTLVATHSP
ncbi:MAG TPA: Tim44/TimA family putative adaptor protein [Stellaceae bacterium]|jgi:predicted lipid-binding transport protein (Tim44 family)|nr:Tim44/TimA family putative adaptor protein [Stellaceae bacterium]